MPRKSRKNVGLIGLGIIGSRVAAALRAAGFHVFVWNRTARPVPNFVGSPAEVAELCEIIQLFVADAQALFDVVDQLRDALTPQHIVICNATVGPEATIEAARLVEEKGAHFLDAPFTGSKGAAEKRSLVYYIGGDDATFLRARPVLEATSKAIVRIGGVGHAATIKIVTNMIAAVSIQTLGEALAIVQKAGLDPEVLAAALEQNACRSGTMDMKLPMMMAGNYEPHFSLKHMFKDVQLGIHVANALDIEIPATTVTAGVMYGALNQGWGDLDFSSLYKIYEPQVQGGASAAELQSGMIQLEDLDPRELHYPETKVPAPPRPLPAAPPAEAEPPAEGSGPEDAPKAEIPTLAAALCAPEELQAAAPVATPEPPGPHEFAPPEVWAEPSPARHAIPGVIFLVPKEGMETPSGTIVLGPNEPPTPEAQAPAADFGPPPLERAEEPAPAATGKSSEEPQEPAVTEGKEEPVVVEFEPDFVRQTDVPTPDDAVKPTEQTAVATSGREMKPSEHPNGAPDERFEAVTKPFNFVKRWFVARTGG